MKRTVLWILFLSLGFASLSQTYNNEWIDYNKTYYKFKVGLDGLYRITWAQLNALGIGSVPAEQFELWRNGTQVPLYTSVPSGPLTASDFIEFWGERNDGKPDNQLYKFPDYQLNDHYSLMTDTASYFLTVNPAGGNSRLVSTVNNVAGNSLPVEPYFMHTEGMYYRNLLHAGYYVDAGEHLYSSSYDRGEGWSTTFIGTNQTRKDSIPVFLYPGGPDATFRINLSGSAYNRRRFRVKINADSIWGQDMDYLGYTKVEVPNVPLSALLSPKSAIQITNQCQFPNDRMVVFMFELDYPRVFNFNNAYNFKFKLPANASGNYLEISKFNYGSLPPVLYDFTNGKRYVGDISDPSLVKFALEPSSVERNLVLMCQDPAVVRSTGSFVTRNFFDINQATNQGDYIIISNPLLFNGAGGTNPVEDYRAYRSSVAGGGYTARIFEADELIDQFAFGIKKNPLGIRNFLRWARANFSPAPKFVLLIGHGLSYNQQRGYESYADVVKLNLVPTFGAPASDILLSADPGQQIPITPIGRISAISPEEVSAYLEKVQQYEDAQKFASPLIEDKGWMKNVIHVIGGNEPILTQQLSNYMDKYKGIIQDTLFGANVYTFKKSSTESVQQLSDQLLKDLFEHGISQLVYFGHSSSTVLDFNLDNPEQYNNTGKYPIFIAMGCQAGNFYNYNAGRFYVQETLSEKFLLTPNKGAIAFIATSHFGIPHYLDIYNTGTYTAESRTHYGKSLGEIMKEAVIQTFNQTSPSDFYARMHTEQNTLHGDPAVKPNAHPKPDYVIEDPLVTVSPNFVSLAETNFKVNAKFKNIGRAIVGQIAVEVKRELPDGSVSTVFKDTISAPPYIDSILVTIPINPTTDKGLNKITVTIDADNAIDELFETNNSVTKEVFIFEDEARLVYPLNYAIVNKQNIKLQASTANPFSPLKQYRMEIDTTEFFNSAQKVTRTLSSTGGVLEFDPGITFTDSTVYYWRVAPLDSQGLAAKWNMASFIYLPNHELGFNQSHFFQHTKSVSDRVYLDSADRVWKYHGVTNNIFVRTGIYPTASSMQSDFTVSINGDPIIGPGCNYNELIINVIDPVSFQPWANTTGTLYGSSNVFCGTQREYNFHYFLRDTLWRRRAQNFLENIVPAGAYVVIRSNTSPNTLQNTYAAQWLADEAYFGAGNTLYHTLKNQGFTDIDNYDTTNCFIFVYKKNGQSLFTPVSSFATNIYERLLLSVNCPTPDTLGYTTSPVFGPAKAWKQLQWRGSSLDPGIGDAPTVDVIGINNLGSEVYLYNQLDLTQQDVDISSVDAAQYPYIKLQLKNLDSVYLTPYQLRYWRLTYEPVPEGAVAPNILFQSKDSLDRGEPLDFKMAFKNISEADFDSLKVKMIVTDNNNVSTTVPLDRFKPLISNDTLHVRYKLNTESLVGNNTLYVDVNPDNDQLEQFHYNNFIYRNFYVRPDNVNPILDVTFDGVHILDRDIVSSKPHILAKLKDESKWMILNDTSGVDVHVRYPDGTLRQFFFSNTDTLEFTAAGDAPNPDNTATIDFSPFFPDDGDYELIVSGKDRSGNTAGNVEYKVGFQVINKPMISNMLNYPNPFTTSTAFVFTITGSEVPQNIKIEIMTITGKIVREITKDELGSLHIGRNITEFKWDGTDQFGQKLANGIYLYRVVTNLNGRSLDKFKAADDQTDKYFNKGYGKMYLMR